ncbi:MAG TPA: ParB/RepB/Spo0J family partition protein [Oligoflexia bacterium]|nr:ParB/RepB/Spo0J family partition protein [Oligoflexia bacterium]HMP47421.1 ParB/RepB/Spo0J family partition protein [Oligoflexia bacterium]
MSRKLVKFDVNPLLSGPSLEARNKSGSPYRVISINDIDVDPDQPRRSFDSQSIAELAASIEMYGLLCPILVTLAPGGTYRLVSGERRLRACKALGLETIAAILDSSEEEGASTLAKQLVENIQRSDLNPMEKALAIGQMKERYDLSVRDIAAQLGISKSSVQRSIELLSLPDDLQAALISGASETKVLALSKVKDIGKRKKLLDELDQLSRLELEYLINGHGSDQSGKLSHGGTHGADKESDQRLEAGSRRFDDQRFEDEMRKALGLKVSLQRSSKNSEKGRLVIDFYSDSDLSELYLRLGN